MIVNHYKALQAKDHGMRYRQMMQLISKTSGIGLNKIRLIISEYCQTKTVTSPTLKRKRAGIVDKIDDCDKSAIRRKVHSFWFNKELPTLPKVLSAINEDETLPNMKNTSLRKVLKSLNFKFIKRLTNSILTENSNLLIWRRKYLTSIRRFREEGRPIYYLDETWINTDNCLNKGKVNQPVTSNKITFSEGLSTNAQNPINKGKKLIILHIGSAAGFIPSGLLCFESKKTTSNYQDEINGQIFRKWFEEILPLLEGNAVVVMDNAPYHSMKNEKIPTITWKKAEIVEWLISKGEKIDPTQFIKNDLMQIVNRLKPK